MKEDKHYTFWGIPFKIFFQFWSCHISQQIYSAVVTKMFINYATYRNYTCIRTERCFSSDYENSIILGYYGT